jgi:hypothetical protein
MPTMPPAEIGAPVSEIDTPALIVDLDALTRNLEKMAAPTLICPCWPQL